MNSDNKQKDAKDDENLNDFDFDEDFGENDLSKMNPLIKKKPTQGKTIPINRKF